MSNLSLDILCPSLDSICIDSAISFMQKSMKSKYLDYWKTSGGDKGIEIGKLHIYRKIKSGFKMEPYLHQIKQLKYSRAMSMFRISAHRLEI